MSENYRIIGGKPLLGEVVPVPNKNSVVSALPACLLTSEDVIYENLPNTTDVQKMLVMIEKLGGVVKTEDGKTIINTSKVKDYTVDEELGGKIRASIMFAGPLLARFGKAKIPVPGGCVLGKRSINAHIDGFMKVGVDAKFTDGWVEFTVSNKNKENFVWMVEASVTATENLILYCAGINLSFEIVNAASEPHVRALSEMLSKMGAKFEGIGSNTLHIEGSENLKGTSFRSDPDFVDVASLIAAIGITKGKVTIKDAYQIMNIGGILQSFSKFGIEFMNESGDLIVDAQNGINIETALTTLPLSGDRLPKFTPQPWPGFPVDCLPPIVSMFCKLNGSILVNNWMYETGLDFSKELNEMGANIFVSDPNRIIVNGPVNFKGGEIRVPGIIQAAMAIFIAALADPVETVLVDAEILKRRYPDITDRFQKLGADVTEV